VTDSPSPDEPVSPVPAIRRRRRAAAAGAASVALALALGELLASSTTAIPSLVLSVGTLVVATVPPAVEDFAIATFGTADKLALAIGTVLIALALGAVIGVRGARVFASAVATWSVFAALGLFAGMLQPQASAGLVLLDVVVVTAAGLGSLWWLLGLARPPAPAVSADGDRTTDTAAERRSFLRGLGAVAAAAVGAWGGSRILQPGSRTARPSAADVPLPPAPAPAPPVGPEHAFSGVDGLTPVVVPNDEFYRIDTALAVPRLDASTWTLRVHGMVEREVVLTWADLAALDTIEQHVTIACVSNEVGDDLVGNALWRGVRLADVLDLAGVEPGAGQVVGRSVDGWTAGFPTELAFDERDAMIAIAMNGEPLPFEHGYPARLIVPGLYGYVSATKWLTELELTTWEGFDAYWVPRGWSKEGPIKTQSRIDVPRANTRIEPGLHTVAGVAWAPTRGISRVELQVDEGPWREAEVTEPLSEGAWVQWRLEVDLGDGVHFLRVRATDGTGATQTEEVSEPRPDGATGWHTVRVFT
jgi:DMSO/TMAO reductase YedYZ molybdopterin-dependent catalytic subunit